MKGSPDAATFRLLGEPEVVANGVAERLPNQQVSKLLIGLLVAKAQRVRRERLMDWVWDQPTKNPKQDLDRLMVNVRKLLAKYRLEDKLESRDGLCQLRISPTSVDVHRCQELINAGDAAPDTGQQTDEYRAALKLFTNEPLAGFQGTRITGFRARWLGERARIRLKLIEIEVSAERYAEVLPELNQFIRHDPTNQKAVYLGMLAYARSGKPDAASELFQNIEKRLRNKAGIEIDRRLRDLHAEIIKEDPGYQIIMPNAEIPAGARADETSENQHLLEATGLKWADGEGSVVAENVGVNGPTPKITGWKISTRGGKAAENLKNW